jgi:DNA-binding protein H-NS
MNCHLLNKEVWRRPMAAVDIDRMTLKQIEDLEARIAKAKSNARESSKIELRAKIDKLVDGTEFTIAQLYGFRTKRGRGGKAQAKYANPDDASQTWTGRGRRPDWLLAKLKKGTSLEDFAV